MAVRLGFSDVAHLWAQIDTAYSEPHRRYHDLSHIDALVKAFDPQAFSDPDTALLALFYHDIVYDPARQDNEARSVDLMRSTLIGQVDETRLDKAAGQILATRKHTATNDPDTDRLLDMDMGILGAPWDAYLAYARGVFAEYEPVYGSDAYTAGRVAMFLEPTLTRHEIFLTETFRPFEARARANLSRELELWRGGGLDRRQA